MERIAGLWPAKAKTCGGENRKDGFQPSVVAMERDPPKHAATVFGSLGEFAPPFWSEYIGGATSPTEPKYT